VALTPDEKQAGRLFRDVRQASLDQWNEADPPGLRALVYWRVVRHECPAARGGSIGITLREVYEASPEMHQCYCGKVGMTGKNFPHRDCDGSKVISPAGQFAFIWKEGTCSGSGCGLVVRTSKGRFVLGTDRPAEHGRANSGREASARDHDSGLARA
jgi:hypothetical protein